LCEEFHNLYSRAKPREKPMGEHLPRCREMYSVEYVSIMREVIAVQKKNSAAKF